MRPIVCCAGTFMNDWSKWLDYWLQQLKPNVPTYTKDSQQILDETRQLNLTPNAKLFTCDAHSMYSNIDTDHAIEVLSWWLRDMYDKNLLPANFPLEAVIDAMTTIMKNNLFEFGDMYFVLPAIIRHSYGNVGRSNVGDPLLRLPRSPHPYPEAWQQLTILPKIH